MKEGANRNIDGPTPLSAIVMLVLVGSFLVSTYFIYDELQRLDAHPADRSAVAQASWDGSGAPAGDLQAQRTITHLLWPMLAALLSGLGIAFSAGFGLRPANGSAAAPTAEGHIPHPAIDFNRFEGLAKTGYYVWDEGEGRYTHLSNAYIRIHGYASSEEYLSHNSDISRDLQCVHPDDRDVYEPLYNGNDDYVADFRIIQPSGDIVWVRETATVEKNKSEGVVRIVGIVQDITDLKQSALNRSYP